MAVFKQALSLAPEKAHYFYLSLVASALSTVLSFGPYVFLYYLLQEMTSSARPDVILNLALWIFVASVLRSLVYIASLSFSHLFAFRLETNLKKQGLEHLLQADFGFFVKHDSGMVRKVIDDNTSNTHTIIAHILPDSIHTLLMPIGILVLGFWMHWTIGCLFIVALALSMVCFIKMRNGSDSIKKYLQALENMNASTVEYVRGIQIIKLFDVALKSFERLYQTIMSYSKFVNQQVQSSRYPYVSFETILYTFSGLIIFVSLFWKLPQGQTIALIVTFASFSGLLFNSFMKIMFFSKNLEMAKDALGKITALIEQMQKTRIEGKQDQFPSQCTIDFEDVFFGYRDDTMILEDFNLRLEAGKTYALVGPSGGGKSTLARLIAGFYSPQKGNIAIGGQPIDELTKEVLAQNVAFVFQEAHLFEGSLLDNIRVAKPEASEQEVLAALDAAQCQEIVQSLPEGIHTIYGAKGTQLSGGQKQRLAVARAILKDAPIVVLDEVSAASDPINEYALLRAFQNLMKDKTVLLIAHRLTSIAHADEILVLEKGKVVERGTQSDLLSNDGPYARLYGLYRQANEWRV